MKTETIDEKTYRIMVDMHKFTGLVPTLEESLKDSIFLTVRDAIELAIAEEREANGWVSVKDRLPEWAGRDDTPCEVNGEKIGAILTSEKVLVVIAPNNTVRIDHLTSIESSNDEHQYEWFYMYKDRVTHWMALPAAPKAEVSE